MKDNRRASSGFAKSLGPGLIWAATAVGVSHLVQSTRAGATYGFALVGVVLLANLLKYPFFEFGPRYAAAMGESLLEGYRRIGRWTVIVFLLLTIGTMFTVIGAITLVTGGLASLIFGDGLSVLGYSIALLGLCAVLLSIGRYPLLDRLIKAIILVLTLSTVLAVLLALGQSRAPVASFVAPSPWTGAGFAFLIALVGWMPSAVDISVWHSLWTLERARQTGHRPRLGEALLDFKIGYVGTACLALFFLSLGALMLFGSGASLEGSAGGFARQLVEVYTAALGPWSRPIILAAAFTTMLSTALSCTDAFPRVLQRATVLLAPSLQDTAWARRLYWAWMAVVVLGALLLIGRFPGSLTFMVDLATTLSFLTAPILGYFNFRVVTGDWMPAEARPAPWLRGLAWVGLVFGVLVGLAFLGWKIGWV